MEVTMTISTPRTFLSRFIPLSAYCFVNVANAGVVEVDIYNNGTNKGFTVSGSSLVWMDFGINNNQSYETVQAQLLPGEVYEGWRVANATEVFSTFASIFSVPGIDWASPDYFGAGEFYFQDGYGDPLGSVWENIFPVLGWNAHIGFETGHERYISIGMFRGGYDMLSTFQIENMLHNALVSSPLNDSILAADGEYHFANGVSITNSTLLVRDVAVVPPEPESVPEPSTLAIFALAMMGLTARVLKKQS